MCEILTEKTNRPDVIGGVTYKIKPPQAEHALYVTINDIILNQGADHETCCPFEIFLNSKNADHMQWASALTRVISAVFHKGGNIKFLADELKAVSDPTGGYWRDKKFMPSLVADIGCTIEKHIVKNNIDK